MSGRRGMLLVAAIMAAAALVLLAMGRTPICTCGTIKLWHGVTMSAENSQHLSDWYSFSHVIHGFIFFGLLWPFAKRLSFDIRLAIATLVESAWEIFENTDFIIDRYRAATISLDYYGDSVVNSLSDIAMMVVGFLLAARLPWQATVAIALVFELFTGFMIRDNLALNVLMLLWPLDAVKQWQTM